jgi:L-amino acid N-acyltransferase YncA
MTDIIIRRANEGDAAGIANVHVNSWREAYTGILSQSYVDGLPLEFNDRYEWWLEVISVGTHPTHVAENTRHGIVGFTSGGDARDEKFAGYAEVYCIYLLDKFHDKGIGYLLLKALFQDFIEREFTKAYVWVLRDNPSLTFYERTGAVRTGDTREDIIGDMKAESLCFEWTSLKLL